MAPVLPPSPAPTQPSCAATSGAAPVMVALAAVLSASGCEGAIGDVPQATSGEFGDVGLALRVVDGIRLNAIEYEIVGSGARIAGVLDVSHSASFSGLITGVPVGTGYRLSLRATAADNREVSCAGSALFDVLRDTTTAATVQLRCMVPRNTGNVSIRGTANVCPVVDSIAVLPASIPIGASAFVSATARDLDGAPAALTYSWSSQHGSFTGPSSAASSFTCTAIGSGTLTLTVRDSECEDALSADITCTSAPVVGRDAGAGAHRDSGSAPGEREAGSDEPEAGAEPDAGVDGVADADIGADAGTSLDDAGSDEGDPELDAGADGPWDAGTPEASAPKDAAADAALPGDAELTPTPDAGEPTRFEAWPWTDSVVAVDGANTFSENLSGLTYESAGDGTGVLWAVQDRPAKLHRLQWNGSIYAPTSGGGWNAGKALLYPNGRGAPDAEGVTKADPGAPALYVAAERDNNDDSVSRISVLRYDTSQSGKSLVATHEWSLNAALPGLPANRGIEAITFIPDAFLVRRGLIDDNRGAAYDPDLYPDHAGGLFFVGIEGTGAIDGYALDHRTGGSQRVVSLTSGQAGVMALEFDRDTGYLWTQCDDSCGNRITVLDLDESGRFALRHAFEPDSAIREPHNEGLALASGAECVDGMKAIFWADDAATDGHSIRRGSVRCDRF